jgi:hypothetical protein
MKRWMASGVRDQFYKSPSFDAFSKSRIYIKLQDRKSDFETALGFGLDEERLSELAGGTSAISIYDIGKLELVFATEIARPQALATALFKQAPQFQERSAGGTPYYVHDVTTDGGRLNQQFCFAYVSGKLIVTTTEGLMVRGLANITPTGPSSPGTDSLLSDVMATSEQAAGFATHDLTLWVDQSRLNQNRYFTNYWIHHNVSEQQANSLAGIQSGVIDFRFAPEGMSEQRWFVLKTDDKTRAAKAIAGEQATGLLRFAPGGAQLVQIHGPASGEDLGGVISRALFGKLPDESASAPPAGSDERGFNSTTDEGHERTERYSSLDMRFDVDVDDEQAPRLGEGGSPASGRKKQAGPASDPEKRFAKAAASVLTKISAAGYSEVTRSSLEAGKPFARFERAVVIEMKSPTAADRAAFERAVVDELRARFVVAGAEPKLEWQEDGGIRYVAQTLLEQGAAYSISGKYLVLASNKEFARDILQAGSAPAAEAAAKVDGPVELYALIRVAAAKPVFDKLMAKLDGRTEEAAKASKKGEDNTDSDSQTNEGDNTDSNNSESGSTVKFFSDNLSSLIAASAIREVRLQRETKGSITIERVNYSW